MRKQAAVTLRCMQALVRVQARVRARHVRMSIEGQTVQKLLDEHRSRAEILKQAEVIDLGNLFPRSPILLPPTGSCSEVG